ncbi:hypothetical protein Ancab_036897 [Ancistrocladus abbreviatus]
MIYRCPVPLIFNHSAFLSHVTFGFEDYDIRVIKKQSVLEDFRCIGAEGVDLKLLLASKCRKAMWPGLMGSNGSWYALWGYINLSFLSFALAFNGHDPRFLDDFLYNHTYAVLPKHRTGVLYNISLPPNFSGMEVSVVRLRSSTFWARGANFSVFGIPPRVLPRPYVKRLAILYENLGNWSSSYYELPGYIFLTPVVGFRAFDASNSTRSMNPKLNLTLHGDRISIRFPQIQLPEKNVIVKKCVRFDPSGSIELSSMVGPSLCSTKDQGHFCIAAPRHVPSSSPPSLPSSLSARRFALWEWGVIGFIAGLIVLILLIVIITVCCKALGSKKIRGMEKQANKSEALSITWIGTSKMPSATMTRTQAALEIDYAP